MRSDDPAKPIPPVAVPPEDEAAYQARRAAFIEAEVERALRMYEGMFPPEVVEAFRERTALFLTLDPQMIRVVDAAVPRLGGDRSEIAAIANDEAAAARAAAPAGHAPASSGPGKREP